MTHEGSFPLPCLQAIADSCIIAFFFLLRVGEYTQSTQAKPTCTVPFRICDIVFWHTQNGQRCQIAPDAPEALILLATEATLKLDNQKNGHRDDTLHHQAVLGPLNPVAALPRRYCSA